MHFFLAVVCLTPQLWFGWINETVTRVAALVVILRSNLHIECIPGPFMTCHNKLVSGLTEKIIEYRAAEQRWLFSLHSGAIMLTSHQQVRQLSEYVG